jgi:ATP-dependent DNA helicase RecG
MVLTDFELEQLLGDGESDRVERKSSWSGQVPVAVREAVCAMANDLSGRGKPGVVFIGANDDGSPAGLSISDQLLLTLGEIKTDGNIVPPPTLFIDKCVLRGAEMAVLTVWPADSPPVRYKGRICVRYGPRRGYATAQDERILNERRRHRDRPYDVQPISGTTLADLDLERFASEYLPQAVAADVLAANERTPQERLAATKMIVGADLPTPTVLGLLVLGKNTRTYLSGAYVQFLRIQGQDLSDPVIDEEGIDGAMSDLIRRLEEKLTAHNRVSVDFTSGPSEHRSMWYPHVALQQLTRNAILHRNYDGTSAPVRVTWYDDRIEISSPGGPFGHVTAENFGRPGVTDYRNPNLAEALKTLGYVQRFGAGIATVKRTLRENGNPDVVFEVDSGYVLATVHRVAGRQVPIGVSTGAG